MFFNVLEATVCDKSYKRTVIEGARQWKIHFAIVAVWPQCELCWSSYWNNNVWFMPCRIFVTNAGLFRFRCLDYEEILTSEYWSNFVEEWPLQPHRVSYFNVLCVKWGWLCFFKWSFVLCCLPLELFTFVYASQLFLFNFWEMS